MQLFSSSEEKIILDLADAEVIYYPNFLEETVAISLFDKIYRQTDWQQDDVKVFGKTYPQPRLTKLFAENTNPYTYSNLTLHPVLFPKYLLDLKKQIEVVAEAEFTSCLANLYRDGQDSNGWHADNEKELGKNPIIASLSLGQARWFHLKHRADKNLKTKLLLTSGSLLLMKGATQHHWLHQIPKTKKKIGERINLTFRKIYKI